MSTPLPTGIPAQNTIAKVTGPIPYSDSDSDNDDRISVNFTSPCTPRGSRRMKKEMMPLTLHRVEQMWSILVAPSFSI
jgi:hypothetical protein